MGATINLTTGLNAMTDHGALAVRTTRRHCVNCTFEAVECHGLSGLRDLERLVVVVAADITNSHGTLPVSKPTLRAHACSWPIAAKKARRAVRPPEPCARTVTAGFMGSDDSPSDLDAKCQTPRRVFVPNYVCNAAFALLDRDQKGAMVLTASRVQCRPPPSDLLLLEMPE